MPVSTMWVRGKSRVRSPLPSLVTSTAAPSAAERKLAPVMPAPAQDAENDVARFARIARPMHLAAARLHVAFEGFEEFVQPRQGVVADGATLFAQRFEIAEARDGECAPAAEMRLQSPQRGAEL